MMAEAAVESPQPETSAAMRGSPTNECTPSPPPNCAICLGNCINKCFSDSCMHQFCFKCLLEWSKVKAVCPLCKQPFKSIIHNVKSNDEYDQHFIPQPTSSEGRFEDLVWRDTSRHFQFRTTLTVDPRGELAIQHLLSTRSMTNALPNSLNVVRRLGDYFRNRDRDIDSYYRRQLYQRNLYTQPMTDVTGRYRDATPSFYREYPGSKHRLVPFLQREIDAILDERSLRAMNLVNRILAAIEIHPIRGRFMRNMLRPELGASTDHFIYEFYTFARSPYDIYGYDRNTQLLSDAPNYTEDSSDSDVLILSVEPAPRRLQTNEVIEIGSESSHDSDVVIREPTPPVTVDLVHTTTTADSDEVQPAPSRIQAPRRSANSRVQPEVQSTTLRHKRRRLRMTRRRGNEAAAASCSSDSDSTSTSEEEFRLRVNKRPLLVRKVASSEAGDSSSSDESETAHRAKRKRLRKMKHPRKHEQQRLCGQAPAVQANVEVQVRKPTSSSTSDTNSSAVENTNIKNEQVGDQEQAGPVHDQPYSAPCLDATLNANALFPGMPFDLSAYYPEYRQPPYPFAFHPVEIPPEITKLPTHYNEQKFVPLRYPDEAGPSGMSSGNSQSWQPKPCSDSD